jgi:hypothetical protein
MFIQSALATSCPERRAPYIQYSRTHKKKTLERRRRLALRCLAALDPVGKYWEATDGQMAPSDIGVSQPPTDGLNSRSAFKWARLRGQ